MRSEAVLNNIISRTSVFAIALVFYMVTQGCGSGSGNPPVTSVQPKGSPTAVGATADQKNPDGSIAVDKDSQGDMDASALKQKKTLQETNGNKGLSSELGLEHFPDSPSDKKATNCLAPSQRKVWVTVSISTTELHLQTQTSLCSIEVAEDKSMSMKWKSTIDKELDIHMTNPERLMKATKKLQPLRYTIGAVIGAGGAVGSALFAAGSAATGVGLPLAAIEGASSIGLAEQTSEMMIRRKIEISFRKMGKLYFASPPRNDDVPFIYRFDLNGASPLFIHIVQTQLQSALDSLTRLSNKQNDSKRFIPANTP